MHRRTNGQTDERTDGHMHDRHNTSGAKNKEAAYIIGWKRNAMYIKYATYILSLGLE